MQGPATLSSFIGSSGIAKGPILLQNGSAAAPSLAFASDPNTGLFSPSADYVGFAANGVNVVSAHYDSASVLGIRLRSDAAVSWSSTTNTVSSSDVNLIRDAANTLALKNGTNLQTFRIYDATGTGYTAYGGAGISTYKNVVTAGWGTPAIYGVGAPGSTVNVGVASIATYTVGVADGDFEVSASCLVTVSTTHSFSLDVTYTDTSNVARTMVLPVNALAGNFITSGLITNVTGAGNYESAVMHISAKASTVITLRTSSGGTFTTVTYFPRAVIKRTA